MARETVRSDSTALTRQASPRTDGDYKQAGIEA